MIGRRLEREVERDLDAERARPSDDVVVTSARRETAFGCNRAP